MIQEFQAFILKGQAMTCEDVARIFQIDAETVRRRTKNGIYPRVNTGGPEVRIDPSGMLTLLSANHDKKCSLTTEGTPRAKSPTKGVLRACL